MEEKKQEFKVVDRFKSREEIKKGVKAYNDPKNFAKPMRQVKRMGRGK